MWNLFFIAFALLFLVTNSQMVSYEGFKVFRVEFPTEESFKILSAIPDISFWAEDHVSGHADIMISPSDLEKTIEKLTSNELEYSVMVENVEDLIKLEKVIVISITK